MFFSIVMTPLMSDLSPSARAEMILKLFPKLTRYVTVFATLTLVFGLALAYGIAGSSNMLSPANPYGLSIILGAITTLVAFGIVHAIVLPSARKMVRALQNVQPPADVSRLQKRMKTGATTVLVLLALALAFMVAAGSV